MYPNNLGIRKISRFKENKIKKSSIILINKKFMKAYQKKFKFKFKIDSIVIWLKEIQKSDCKSEKFAPENEKVTFNIANELLKWSQSKL